MTADDANSTPSGFEAIEAVATAGALSEFAAELSEPLECDDDAYRRVVQLYKMQLYWLFPAKLRLLKQTKFMKQRAKADEAVILRGGMLAAIEAIERVMPTIRVAGLRAASRGPKDPFYGKFETVWPIFREHLWLRNPGHRLLTRMSAKVALRRRIREKLPIAIGPAALVYILYHAKDKIAELLPNSKAAAAAAEVICEGEGPCPFHKSFTSLRDYWQEMKSVAIFHYLVQYQCFDFGIQTINNTVFIDRMLEMVKDTGEIRTFFATHDYLANLLNQRGHDFPILGESRAKPRLRELEVTDAAFERLKTVRDLGAQPF